MNSLGKSSKWPSYDSLPSTSSFLPSESEQTEDEADVFSEGEGDGGMRKSASAYERITLSGNYLDFPPRSDQLHSKSECDESEHCPDKTKHPDSASSLGPAALRSSSATPGDLAFAQKCADLHRFTYPLLELLHGLKSGRFDRGTFQQSVAIDRLQRILGILQKPEMGEKYLQNLLQIEILLKMWFPQMAFKSSDTPNETTTPKLGPHWHQNQLHMPVKVEKLSWSDPDQPGKVPAKHYSPSTWKSMGAKTPEDATAETAGDSRAAGHEFTGMPSYLCSRRENPSRKQPQICPPSLCGSPATQDSSVSSSNTITTTDSPYQPMMAARHIKPEEEEEEK
uniref:Circadian associated repressor of transcription a n=1 Tax=Amphiprion percula TaxID=161767 RepID=A0A3P8SJZ6_AMPPE